MSRVPVPGRSRGPSAGRAGPLRVPELLRATERLALCLEAGLSWPVALREAGADRLTGSRPVEARALAGRSAVLVAIRVVERLGAPGAGVLSRAAAGVREQVAADGRRAGAVAGPAMSARIVGGLPLAGPLVAALLGVDPLAVLLGTSLGRVCAVLGVLLLALSWWWASRLVAAAAAVTTGRGGVEEAVVCDLVAAALDAGVATSTALLQVARALDEVPGADPSGLAGDLRRCAVGLDVGDLRLVAVSGGLEALLDAVSFSARTGAPAGRPLLLAGEELRRDRDQRAATATARLAASLVLPLGLAALPGFLLLGVAPVVVHLLGTGLA